MSKKGNEKPSAENPRAEDGTPTKSPDMREKVTVKPPTGNLITGSRKPAQGIMKKSSKNEK